MPPLDATFGLVNPFHYGPAWQDRQTIPGFAGNVTGRYVVGGAYQERIIAVSFTLTCVGGAGTRLGLVELVDGGGAVLAAAVSPFNVSAGNHSRLTFVYDGSAGGANDAAAITGVLPGVFLQGDDAVVVSVLGGLAADSVSDVRIVTEKFSTAPDLYAPGFLPDYAAQ